MTVRMLLCGLLSSTALIAIQGCGGGRDGGGYGGKSQKANNTANPPKAPGPCKCIGDPAFADSGKLFKKYPADTGKFCSNWDKEYNRRCEEGGESGKDGKVDEDWNKEWCEKIYCIVPKDCELDDTTPQYDGNYAEDPHKMTGYWSSKNCDASLVTGSGSKATTPSP
jgi:hypothetical protein